MNSEISSPIKIVFEGDSESLQSISTLSKELFVSYNVSYQEARRDTEHFDYLEGSEIVKHLVIVFHIASPFLVEMKKSMIQMGLGWTLKEVLFQPIFDWLKKHDSVVKPDELTFNYDDIQIKFAYSKGNQINIVSQLFLSFTNHISDIKKSSLGDLKVIATPLFQRSGEWFFGLPEYELTRKDYFVNWGLEFNHNRCIFQPEKSKWIYELWWD
jgi:hypothetical protein